MEDGGYRYALASYKHGLKNNHTDRFIFIEVPEEKVDSKKLQTLKECQKNANGTDFCKNANGTDK